MLARNFFIIFWLLSAAAYGQDLKSTPAVGSVIDFRPIGEQRLWTFVSRDSVLGRLISTVKETKEVDGREGLVIQQELGIDLSKIGGAPLVKTSSEIWVSREGYYLGEETEFEANEESNNLKLAVEGKRVTGYFTRAGDRVRQELSWPSDRFVINPYFADEYELFFAQHGLAVGSSFEDSTFSSHTLLFTPLSGTVENFIYTELYKGHFDSVYVVRLTQPEEYTLLITPDYRLLRMDFPGIRLRAYLDRVARPQAPAAGAPIVPEKVSPLLLIMRLAHWLVYLVVGCAILLFFVRRQYKPWPNWIGLLVGCLGYLAVVFVQFPVQEWMITKWIAPRIETGGSVLAWGVIPSLFAGLLQPAMLLAAVVVLARLYHPAKHRLPFIGAFVAAGFAIAEAFYQTTPGPLIGWPLFERSFMLLLHIAAGYLLGYFLALGRGLAVGWILIVAANSLVRYLPLLLPQRVVTLELLNLLLAFVALIIAAMAILAGQKKLPDAAPVRTARSGSTGNPLT